MKASKKTGTNAQASIFCIENSDRNIEKLDVNPINESISLTRSLSYDEKRDGRAWGGPVTYSGGSPDTLSVELLFDQTVYEPVSLDEPDNLVVALAKGATKAAMKLFSPSDYVNDDDIQKDIAKLYRLTMPMLNTTDYKDAPKAQQLKNARPPLCAFIYGNFEFIGFIESLGVQYKVFDEKGNPRRATVSLTFKGRGLTGKAKNAASLALVDLDNSEKAVAEKFKGLKDIKMPTNRGLDYEE